MSFDDLIAFVGLCFFIAGIYLWLGLPAALIVAGLLLMFIGVRIELPRKGGTNEPG